MQDVKVFFFVGKFVDLLAGWYMVGLLARTVSGGTRCTDLQTTSMYCVGLQSTTTMSMTSRLLKKKSCKNSALSVQRQGVEHLADDSCCQLYPVQHRPAVCTCVVFAGRTAAWGQWGEKESPAVRALTCRRNWSYVPLRIPRTIGVCWPSGLFSIIIIIIFSNIIFLSFVHVGTNT